LKHRSDQECCPPVWRCSDFVEGEVLGDIAFASQTKDQILFQVLRNGRLMFVVNIWRANVCRREVQPWKP